MAEYTQDDDELEVIVNPAPIQTVVVNQGGTNVTVGQPTVINTVSTSTETVLVEEIACGGGGGASSYTNTDPMPQGLGGLPTGKTFDNEPISQVLTELLYPYQQPTVSSFTVSGQPTVLDVGAALPGSLRFSWSFSHPENITAGSVQILDGSTVVLDSLDATGSVTVPVAVPAPTSPTTHSWTLLGRDSKNNTVTATYTIGWRWRDYTGTSTSTTLTDAQILTFASSLATTSASTYSFPAGGYKYFAFPASFAAPSTFTDTGTQLSVTMADATDDPAYSHTVNGTSFATFDLTNGQGVTTSYRLYRTRYVLGGAITIRVA